MALQKTIPTPYGVDLTYWKVTRLNIDWLNQIGEVFLGGWPNQQARLNGVQALEYKTQVFRHDDWPFTADGYNITEAYERLKLPIMEHVGQGEMHDNNPFTGATDVYEPGQPGERP
jgi:hypothetical protein